MVNAVRNIRLRSLDFQRTRFAHLSLRLVSGARGFERIRIPLLRNMEVSSHQRVAQERVTGSHEKNVRDKGYRFRAVQNAMALRDVVTFQ